MIWIFVFCYLQAGGVMAADFIESRAKERPKPVIKWPSALFIGLVGPLFLPAIITSAVLARKAGT